ncbi:uncharacterized protein N7498_008981 [Penicillium cinerascens]|uniref:Zn(2)-C6 fungal-type domain-containing protein n=1 Tax=Penicillium cinerascens TaxID=70096 RepID=A0A9W9JER9_9EURO|nr:uncharacterized protein N7498_008981 [Penicillium cinerascens]KAJ5195543.1 hypothetical protein N7498_008981 [Penicillium cinerascens]
MVPRQLNPTTEVSHSSGIWRKRVRKACDRCRLKKTKCDGTKPCSRCQIDNSICLSGEGRSVPNKVHPKGYVEILERQQVWLVRGLRQLYRHTIESGVWPGDPLELETDGHPLTYDLLARLGDLDQTKGFCFEEDTQSLCRRDPDDARDSSSSSLDSSVHQHKPMASLAGEPMSAGSEDDIKPQPGNDGMVFAPLSVKGAVKSPTSLDVRQQTGEPMSAGSEDNIKPQPGNDGLAFTPLSVKGAVRSPMSLDVRPHRQQQGVGADMDALFHQSDLLIAADQTSFMLDGLVTAASSSETPIPLISAPPAPLPEPVIDPESALNFDLASFGLPSGIWKTYAF